MEFLSPGVHFGPRHFTPFNGQQFFAVRLDSYGDAVSAQGNGAGERRPQQVHGVFPTHFALISDVLLTGAVTLRGQRPGDQGAPRKIAVR